MKITEGVDLEKHTEGREEEHIAQHPDYIFMKIAEKVNRSEDERNHVVPQNHNSSTSQ